MAVAATRVYVVYDQRTGAIAHVHESGHVRGRQGTIQSRTSWRAPSTWPGRFGHRVEGLRALQVDSFDSSKALRVDPRTMRLVPIGGRRTAGTKRALPPERRRGGAQAAPAKRPSATVKRRPRR